MYAIRFDSHRTGKSGWVPAVRGCWQKGVRHEDRTHLPLTPGVLAAHLKGEVHVGLYPLLDRDKCWWLAADFDGPEAMLDALMSVKADRADRTQPLHSCGALTAGGRLIPANEDDRDRAAFPRPANDLPLTT